jgi:hypothetical protein
MSDDPGGYFFLPFLLGAAFLVAFLVAISARSPFHRTGWLPDPPALTRKNGEVIGPPPLFSPGGYFFFFVAFLAAFFFAGIVSDPPFRSRNGR